MKIRSIPVLFLLSCAPMLLAAEQSGSPNSGKQESDAQQGQNRLMNSEDIIGAKVTDSKGENVGEIKQLILDPQSAKIDFAILSVGGGMGIGGGLAAVPWSELHPAKEKGFTTGISKDKLKNAPSFEKEKWMNYSRADWEKMISLYVPNQGQQGATAGQQNPNNFSEIEQREASRRTGQPEAIGEAPEEQSTPSQESSPSQLAAPNASPSPSATPTPAQSPSPSPATR